MPYICIVFASEGDKVEKGNQIAPAALSSELIADIKTAVARIERSSGAANRADVGENFHEARRSREALGSLALHRGQRLVLEERGRKGRGCGAPRQAPCSEMKVVRRRASQFHAARSLLQRAPKHNSVRIQSGRRLHYQRRLHARVGSRQVDCVPPWRAGRQSSCCYCHSSAFREAPELDLDCPGSAAAITALELAAGHDHVAVATAPWHTVSSPPRNAVLVSVSPGPTRLSVQRGIEFARARRDPA
mmetsp:Transcript_19817/g.40207  ORF Transcript_19817/g.40207 Transcript_19817/m.40207 type:complete len:247 (+) Transcript_19817:468-1208(+)